MEPTITLDAQAFKALIKESVRKVMREECLKFFELLTPYVEIRNSLKFKPTFSLKIQSSEDFVDITDWFEHEGQACKSAERFLKNLSKSLVLTVLGKIGILKTCLETQKIYPPEDLDIKKLKGQLQGF